MGRVAVKLKNAISAVTVFLTGLMTVMALPAAANAAELLMFESSHCPWCVRWHDQIGVIYPKTEEGRIAPLRTVDVDYSLPDDIVHISPGYYTPIFVLVDDGREIGRIIGYPGEDFFWALLDQMIEKMQKNRAAALAIPNGMTATAGAQ